MAAGLAYDELAKAIRENSTVMAVGRVAQDYKQYLVVSAQEAHSAEDVANVLIAPNTRVRDLATVVSGTEHHIRVISGDASIGDAKASSGLGLAIVRWVAESHNGIFSVTRVNENGRPLNRAQMLLPVA